MQVLVVAMPQHPIPPSEMPGIIEGANDWYARHKDEFDLFGTFPGGGGFGVIDVDDAARINQLMLEMPFSPFSHYEVRPFLPGDTGFAQLREAMAAQAASQQ
jgi:hypothetical protein